MSALALIAGIGLSWLLGDIAGVMVIQQLALVGMIQLLFLTVLGWRAFRLLAFPLAYLVFAVPLGEFLVPTLQDITAVFVVQILRLIDIPVFLEGVFITVPTGNFKVAEACSGLRFLIASIALGTLFAYVTYRTLWRQAVFIGLTLIVPVIANGFRAFGIVYLAHLTNNRLAVGVDHLIYGWIFFSFVTILLLAIGMAMRERNQPPERAEHPSHRTPPVPPAAPAPPRSGAAVAALAAVCVAALSPAYAGFIERRGDAAGMTAALVPPDIGGGWHRKSDDGDSWLPHFPGSDAKILATYVKDGREVRLFIAYYTHQRQGAELVSADNSVVAGANSREEWSTIGRGGQRAVVDGRELSVVATRMRAHRRARVVWHWYWIAGKFTADNYYAKILEAQAKIFGGPLGGATIAVAADYLDAPSDAVPVLRDFLVQVASFTTCSSASKAADDRRTRTALRIAEAHCRDKGIKIDVWHL